MKRFLTFSLVLFILAATPMFASTVFNYNGFLGQNREQTLRQLEHQIAEAFARQDINYLTRILDEAAIVTFPRSGGLNKKETLARIKSKADGIESIKVTSMDVRLSGSIAIITGQISIEGEYDEISYERGYHRLDRFTHTFVERQGQWYLLAAHSSTYFERRFSINY